MAPSHLATARASTQPVDGEEEFPALYLKRSREASGIGSFGLCLSSAPVVNQLGDQRGGDEASVTKLSHTAAAPELPLPRPV